MNLFLMEMDSIAQVSSSLQANTCLINLTVPDPCLMDPCDVNADCVREGLLSPNFTCTCNEPYSDGDGFNCSSK